jgi:hypothetical protein
MTQMVSYDFGCDSGVAAKATVGVNVAVITLATMARRVNFMDYSRFDERLVGANREKSSGEALVRTPIG